MSTPHHPNYPEPPPGHEDDVAGLHGRLRIQKSREKDNSGAWMDLERQQVQAYEYLCHIGETKEWIEACIKEEIGSVTVLEEELRNGIALAKLARSFSPKSVKRIFEDRTKLQFRHSDNINCLFAAMKEAGLPSVFFFELTDLYEKKNIPKVIYCIHALSHVLAKKGLAPEINNLVGKLEFTEEQLDATKQSLEQSGVQMPHFGNLEVALAAEMKVEPVPEEPRESVAPPPPPPEPPVEEAPVVVVLTEEQKRELFLKENEKKIIKVQSLVRRRAAKKAVHRFRVQTQHDQKERLRKVTLVQAQLRMRQARKKFKERLAFLQQRDKEARKIQATWRMYKTREEQIQRMEKLRENEWLFVKLQARVRGKKARLAYKSKQQFYKTNESSVTKIQALWRAKHAKKAYKALSALNDPQIHVIQEFIHLLDDSDKDFEDELDLEDLRQQVIKKIRETIQTDLDLNELDVKIALLVRNRISLEEVVHSTRRMKIMMQNSGGGAAATAAGSAEAVNPFSSKTMDKEARYRLERYQQLFYLLQTQQTYLAMLMYVMNKTSGAQSNKFMEQVVLTLYGYAQNSREEYLLLSLIKTSIKVEVNETAKIDEFWRANPLFIKLVLQYTRGAKERQFLRDLLQPLVKNVMADNLLSLETDPVTIYRNLIRDEEVRTGEISSRSRDVTPELANADSEVQTIQKKNLQKLQALTDQFLDAIIGSLKKMPYSLRYIALELQDAVKNRFPGNDAEVTKIVGNFIYYRYMNPAIVAPEGFDVIDTQVSPAQRKNLAEIARVLHQISVNRTIPGDQDDLASYIASASKRFSAFFNEVANVITAEEYFNMDQFMDMSRQRKPSIFITPNEIYRIHLALDKNLDVLAPDPTDPLRIIISELGPAPPVSDKEQSEVHLTLVNRFAKLEDESEIKLKHLLADTKRLIIAIVRVQSGHNLLDILEAPVTEEQERQFQAHRAAEMRRYLESREKKSGQVWRENGDLSAGAGGGSGAAAANGGRRSASAPGQRDSESGGVRDKDGEDGQQQTLAEQMNGMTASGSMYFGSGSYFCLKGDDKNSLTFSTLKKRALENMAKLEDHQMISKQTHYQDMVNMIARDMLTKHRRKTQRRREFESLKRTLNNLSEKAAYLDEQKRSYEDYINSCIAQLNKKTGKGGRKAPLLFSRQYYHVRELQRAGKMPQFGSFKYTAAELMKKGVIIAMDDTAPKQHNQITLTISSDEAGIFNVEAAFAGVKATETMELRLEDLLQSQYNGVQVITLFGMAKVNVNLLTYLLNKKFFV
ncbi:hypothetical protein DFJ73DRAFT_795084 [Zopfochytrium polystomum]|nr:hypothetical protein DFJ73DRAFT_795084 [Zopfochytrium polystomum]